MSLRISKKFHFSDFTESEYQTCLRLARQNYSFITAGEYKQEGKICFWRHDIDYSPQRALKLARIEHQEGVRSTYYVSLHSKAYNFLEKDVFLIVKEIQALGHAVGLHFDFDYYSTNPSSRDNLEDLVSREKVFLENQLSSEIYSLSLHNPTLIGFEIPDERFAGMVNVYSRYFTQNFSYVSDSSCYWRFRRLKAVLEEAQDEKLHVLTHPVCWTPRPMSPYKRILRSADGRREDFIKDYVSVVTNSGRKIIK